MYNYTPEEMLKIMDNASLKNIKIIDRKICLTNVLSSAGKFYLFENSGYPLNGESIFNLNKYQYLFDVDIKTIMHELINIIPYNLLSEISNMLNYFISVDVDAIKIDSPTAVCVKLFDDGIFSFKAASVAASFFDVLFGSLRTIHAISYVYGTIDSQIEKLYTVYNLIDGDLFHDNFGIFGDALVSSTFTDDNILSTELTMHDSPNVSKKLVDYFVMHKIYSIANESCKEKYGISCQNMCGYIGMDWDTSWRNDPTQVLARFTNFINRHRNIK